MQNRLYLHPEGDGRVVVEDSGRIQPFLPIDCTFGLLRFRTVGYSVFPAYGPLFTYALPHKAAISLPIGKRIFSLYEAAYQ